MHSRSPLELSYDITSRTPRAESLKPKLDRRIRVARPRAYVSNYLLSRQLTRASCCAVKQLHYTRANYALAITTTVTAVITSIAAIISLFWWWTQHYLLYRRNHIHHRHVAREEARAARYRHRFRGVPGVGTGVDERPPYDLREPAYRRGVGDLQRELEMIVNEARARHERLRVSFTMQELEAAVELQQEMAQAA